jgi:hypothetical protein
MASIYSDICKEKEVPESFEDFIEELTPKSYKGV